MWPAATTAPTVRTFQLEPLAKFSKATGVRAWLGWEHAAEGQNQKEGGQKGRTLMSLSYVFQVLYINTFFQLCEQCSLLLLKIQNLQIYKFKKMWMLWLIPLSSQMLSWKLIGWHDLRPRYHYASFIPPGETDTSLNMIHTSIEIAAPSEKVRIIVSWLPLRKDFHLRSN